MAIGKNKKAGSHKKGKVKKTDPFLKKEWYFVRTPGLQQGWERTVGKTVVTRTIGTKVAKDSLMGRIFEVSLADLKQNTEDVAYRKFKLKVEEVSGQNCLTQFHGMSISADKLRSLVRKWQTLIETHVDVRTTDGYALRLFCIAFTNKREGQQRKTTYATAAQIKAIRKKMNETITKEASAADLNELVSKLTTESIGQEITKHCEAIYPLKDCMIMKVKMLRQQPKIDPAKLLEAVGGVQGLAALATADKGTAVAAAEEKKKEAAATPEAEMTPADKKEDAKDAKKEDAKDAKKGGDDKKKDAKKGGDKKGDKPAAAAKPAADKKAKGGDKKKEEKKKADA